jgi:hypothetical protein
MLFIYNSLHGSYYPLSGRRSIIVGIFHFHLVGFSVVEALQEGQKTRSLGRNGSYAGLHTQRQMAI